MKIIEIILFILLGLQVLYLLIFSIAARFYKEKNFQPASSLRRIAIFIPAYREDAVIVNSANAALSQEYPRDKYDLFVISDRMTPATNASLKQLPLILIKMPEEENTKAKALNIALKSAGEYDIAVILDADNICSPRFLKTLNEAFEAGYKAVQAHRTAKNTNRPFALLDAASEEINNTIFRQGHNAIGFSSALIGSGMAFDYSWFKSRMNKVSTAGEDKEIEYLLLSERIKILYLNNEYVLDEKVSQSQNFYRQRRRWLSAQFYHLKEILPDLPNAILEGNLDLTNKIIQQTLLPRVLLLGTIFLCTFFFSVWHNQISTNWLTLCCAITTALAAAVPSRMINRKLFAAFCHIPLAFILMFLNLFRLKEGKTKFIHTEHSGTDKHTCNKSSKK